MKPNPVKHPLYNIENNVDQVQRNELDERHLNGILIEPYELEWFEVTGNEIDFKQVMVELQDEVKCFSFWLAEEGVE